MSKTTIAWLVIYCFGAAASFVHPLYGTLTYLFEYYLRPALHWWGLPLPDLRWNLTISAILVTSFVMHRRSLEKIVDANKAPALFLLALALWMLFVSLMAVNRDVSFARLGDYLKLVLFLGLIVGTLRSEWGFDAFITVHMLGAGWWGWEVYLDPRREQGRLYNIGSGDTLGDNFAALHLLTVIPFLIIYALVHHDKRLRAAAAVIAVFVTNAFILCNSRGATVGLALAGLFALLIAKSGHRIRAAGVVIAVAVMFFALSDPEFIQRQQTTANYETDGAATGRLDSWRGGYELIKDYPFGTGGGGYHALSPVYIPAIVQSYDGALRAPHNTFVLVTSEWGIPGLALFLGYYLSCFRLLHQVRRSNPQGGIWYYRSVAIQMSMVGLLVGGTFSDRLYAEAPYWMGGLAIALHRLNANRLVAEKTDATSEPSVAGMQWSTLHPVAARIAAARAWKA